MSDCEGPASRVLYVGPGGEVARSHAARLERGGFDVETVEDPTACLDHVTTAVDCVVSTDRLDGTDGVSLLREVRESHPDLPFVLVAMDGDEATASRAIRAGVSDYVPVDGPDLPADFADRVAGAIGDSAAREHLRDVKSQLEASIEAGAIGTWEWDIPEDRVVAGSSLAEKFGVDTGAAREGLPLDQFIASIHEDDRERVEARIEEALQACGDYEAEYRVRNAEGEYRWVVARGHVECDEEGRPQTFPGALVDITERKRAERELESVHDRISSAFYALDRDLRFTYVDERAEELLGLDAGDLVGEHVWDVFPEARGSELDDAYHEALETQESITVERFSEALDCWLHARIHPSETGLSVYFRDVTGRKEQEQRLRAAKAQLEASVEAGAIGTWQWHVPEDHFVAGASLARKFGVDPESARQGVSLDRLLAAIHEADRERVERKIEETLESCGDYEAEYRVWNAEDELRWVIARGHVECDEAGDPQRFPGALVDITERKRAEQELEEHRKQLETMFELLPVGIVVADAAGKLLEANEAAREVWGGDVFDAESVADYDRYTAWWAETGERVEPEEWTMSRVLDGDEVTDPDEVEIETADGERRYVMATGMPIRDDDGEVTRGVVTVTDITERKEREQALRDAHEVFTDPSLSFDEQLTSLLDLGGEAIGTEYGALTRERDGDYVFEAVAAPPDGAFRAGDTIPVGETICERTASSDDSVVLRDIASDAPELQDREFAQRGVACYLGSPVTVDGDVRGVLCFYDGNPRSEAFSDWKVTFVDLLSNWVSYELERRQTTERLSALNNINGVVRDINRALAEQSSRGEIEEIACERLAESDSYRFAWVGTVEEETGEVVPSTRANTDGYLDEVAITADESPTGQGPGGQAIRTGETQVVQRTGDLPRVGSWHETLDDWGIEALASVPIAYEDHSYGILNVYTARESAFDGEEKAVISQLGEIMGLAITTVEHEHQLQHERERLAFINSLLRHNLLNDLNIIHARAGILEGHVDDEGREHLDVMRNYADEMADLIDTLRSLTQGLVEADHELEPVDTGDVLRRELDRVSRISEDAVFDVRVDLDAVPRVMADDLLGELFQNLLVNAVQHNDAATPRVSVDVTADDERLTVEIADNGPGIPDDIKDHVFEKGEKGLDSRGTGYGLHLVREIVHLYGGEVSAENTGSGAVFTITLPRATHSEEQLGRA